MTPQTPASVPGSPQPQQAPFGASPATGPTPNRGFEAAGLQKLGSVVKQLEELVPMFGAASMPGKAVLDALTRLIKLVPAGSVTPASQKNNIEQMAMRNTRDNQQMQALQAQRAQGAGGGQPPQAGQPGQSPGAQAA
jgi:hypothetical protein